MYYFSMCNILVYVLLKYMFYYLFKLINFFIFFLHSHPNLNKVHRQWEKVEKLERMVVQSHHQNQ